MVQIVKNLPAMQEIPWRRKWQPTPIFLPGKSYGERKPNGLQFMSVQRVGHD